MTTVISNPPPAPIPPNPPLPKAPKEEKKKAKPDPSKNNFRHFIRWGGVLFPVMVIVNTVLFHFLFARNDEPFFYILAAAIVVSWILILTLYYVWAIYFYNINRTWTDKDWDDHAANVLVQGTANEPEKNPNNEETLGLPPGTVRGTIALSVLVGGMAMMVASLAMPGRLAQNEFLVDNFEYIKTAFLMVIAFYFGTKSLEFINRTQVQGRMVRDILKEQTSGTETAEATSTQTSKPAAGSPLAAVIGDISKGPKGTPAASGPFDDETAQG